MAKGKKKGPWKATKSRAATAQTPVEQAAKGVSTVELILKLRDFLKQEGASGYVCGVAGSDGKILPYIGANNIGDLLTIKYVVEKEISKLIEQHTASVSDSPAEVQKEQ